MKDMYTVEALTKVIERCRKKEELGAAAYMVAPKVEVTCSTAIGNFIAILPFDLPDRGPDRSPVLYPYSPSLLFYPVKTDEYGRATLDRHGRDGISSLREAARILLEFADAIDSVGK